MEKNLDGLPRIGEGEATACREAPIFHSYSDSDDDSALAMGSHLGFNHHISTPQGRFVYWKGFEPAELLHDSHLVADDDITPFRYTH